MVIYIVLAVAYVGVGYYLAGIQCSMERNFWRTLDWPDSTFDTVYSFFTLFFWPMLIPVTFSIIHSMTKSRLKGGFPGWTLEAAENIKLKNVKWSNPFRHHDAVLKLWKPVKEN